MAAYTTYYPTVGSQGDVKPHDGPFYYQPDGKSYGYARGPWNKFFGQYSYGTWWKLYPFQMTDSYPNTQAQNYQVPATPTPYLWHLASWISPRLKAQTLGGTIDLIMGVYQSAADCQFGWRILVWVSQGPYFLPERGLALDYREPPGRPFPLVSTGWGLPTPQALAAIAIQDGDYLTIEAGVIAYAAPGASRSSGMAYAPVTGPPPTGFPNPPLAVGSTLTTDHAGRVLFSQPLALLDGPTNDACATPIVITTLPYVEATPVIAELATYDPATDLITGPPGGAGPGEGLYNTVWWGWTAPETGTLRIEATQAGGDSSLVAYTGSCGGLTKVISAVGYNGSVPLLKVPVTVGTTYRFRFGGRNHLSATVPSLKARMVVRPSNDDFANRTVIPSLPFSETNDLTLATMEPGEPWSPTDWTSNPVQSVWYEWTADSAPGHVRINTMGSDFDSQITVWTRAPLSTFPVPPATDLYDDFVGPDTATLGPRWSVATAWGPGTGLQRLNQSATSPTPAGAGNYWSNSYGPDCEFWGLIRGSFPSTADWVEIDGNTSNNPSALSRNGFWVGAKRDGAGYHAQLGRYTVGAKTVLGTSTLPTAITGIGFRRLGSTLQLWVQRGGAWSPEFQVTDTNHAVALHPTIGVISAAPGNVAFETIGGSALRSWLGDLWIEVFSSPWTNTNEGEDTGYYDQANMVFRPTPGVTYYITVFSGGGSYYSNDGGSTLLLTLARVTPIPTNETCATALAVTAIPCYTTVDITNAADGQMELVPLDATSDIYTMEQNDSGKVLWYKWTADRTTAMNYNSFGSGWGGPFQEVVLYRGSCGALEILQSNSFNMRYEATQLFFTPELGTTYYWRVTSQGRISGLVYFFLDEHHTTFQAGDVILGDDYVWLFAPSGAARLITSADGDIPTGSGIDPVSGLLYVATFFGDNVLRYGPRLERLGSFPTAPGETPEVPGFFKNGELYVGHWGNYSTTEGIDGLVDPRFAIRRFNPDTGALLHAYLAKQENDGTAWLDPAKDQQTIHYTSRGRKILAYDVLADVQLPDVATLVGAYPTYRARGLRHQANGDLLIADAFEIKRVSATGTVLQRYAVDGRDDLNILDQDPSGTTMWVGDQDTSLFYRVDIATGAILLTVPGGHFGAPYQGAGHLCGLSVVGGYRAGVYAPPKSCVVDFPTESIDPLIPAGTIMVGGWGDAGHCAFLSPDGATSYPPPAGWAATQVDADSFCRTSAHHIGVCGGNAPHFPETGSGLLKASDLSILSENVSDRAAGKCIAADGLGNWYNFRVGANTGFCTRFNAASQIIASWDIPLGGASGYQDSQTWAMAVSEDGQTAYVWLQKNPFTSDPDRLNYRIVKFDLSGAGALIGPIHSDFTEHPGANSLQVVPGSGDILAAFNRFNGSNAAPFGAVRRYTQSGAVVWTAGTPSGGGGSFYWENLALGVLGDTHFLAVAYTDDVTSSNSRYVWFDYATGTPDNTRNFAPDGAGFEFDSQVVVLAENIQRASSNIALKVDFPIDPE